MEENSSEKMVPRRIFQYLAAVFCSLNIICSGMHFGWPSAYLPVLLSGSAGSRISDSEGSWIAVMSFVGSLVGGLLGGLVLHLLSRKRAIALLSLPYMFSWLAVSAAAADGTALLCTARFVAGISDGLAFCVVPVYLAEIAEPTVRGILGSSVAVASVLGTVLVNALATVLDIREAALVSAVFPLACLIVSCLWLPESPYFLLMSGNVSGAKLSLQKLTGRQDVDDDLQRIGDAVEEQKQISGQHTAVRQLANLFVVRPNRHAMIVSMGLRTAQQLCGITAISFYAQVIFREADAVIPAHVATILFFLVQLLCGCFCSFLVDKTGRKPLLLISVTGTGLCLLVEALYLHEPSSINFASSSLVSLVALFMYIVVFSVGMQSIPLLVLSEIFPVGIKAYAISFNDIYFCLLATLSSKFFQVTKDAYGLHVPFFFFSACCAVAFVFIVFIVPETKRKTLEQIQDELKRKKTYRRVSCK